MLNDDTVSAATRRTVLKATAGALGLAATGTASAHDWGDGSGSDGDIRASGRTEFVGTSEKAEVVGYHSLGGVGSADFAGRPEDPHYGAVTEIRTHGDFAYVSFFSSDNPTPGRGMAIVDIGDYNRAETDAELANADLSVLSFVANNSTETAVMDLKVSDDGDYVFFGTQPYTLLFSTDDPTRNEALDPLPNTDDSGFTEAPGAVVAVDVSDKGNPETVGVFEISGTGVHNLFHHRIGESEYVFAIHDLNDGTEGVYVLEFDRNTGQFEAVNLWTKAGNTSEGSIDTSMLYIHDMEVEDDPRSGKPTGYLGYWDGGLEVLDLSDPESIERIGYFEMGACHFTSPAPTLVDGERLCVASQERASNESGTGEVNLVRVEGIYPEDPTFDSVAREEDGAATLEALDTWEWQSDEAGDDAAEYQVDDVSFGDFTLSPHNSDFAKHGKEFWIHQAHYHGGVRYLRVKNGNISEKGFSRPVYEAVPDDSKMQGLTEVTPNIWGAVQSNGVTFASDINQGVHAVKADGIDLGGAPPTTFLSRSDDGSAFTGGQTNQVSLSVESSTDTVLVRDRLPVGWSVVGGDTSATYTEGASPFVEFEATVDSGDTVSYFAEAPSGLTESDTALFGPAEVSADGGETWHAVPGTLDTNALAGTDTSVAAIPAGLSVAALAHQRERIAGRVRDLLNRE